MEMFSTVPTMANRTSNSATTTKQAFPQNELANYLVLAVFEWLGYSLQTLMLKHRETNLTVKKNQALTWRTKVLFHPTT